MIRAVFLPRTPDELWDVLDEHPEGRVFAGGTDLFVRLRRDPASSPSLIGLERIEELRVLREEGPRLFVGSGVSHSRLLASSPVKRFFPVLEQALRVLGSPPVRHMGTLGGNLVTASPAGDTLPPLTVLDAELELRTRQGSRRVSVPEFIRGPGNTVLNPGEIVAGVRLKMDTRRTLQYFEKVGQRNALAIALVSMAAVLQVSESGVVERARLAWGSVGPTVITSPEAERRLEGHPISHRALEEAAEEASNAVRPIDDLRAGAAYRRQVAGNLVLRLEACIPARGAS